MFSRTSNSFALRRILSLASGSCHESKIADFKPELHVPEFVDMIESCFQMPMLCLFSGMANSFELSRMLSHLRAVLCHFVILQVESTILFSKYSLKLFYFAFFKIFSKTVLACAK